MDPLIENLLERDEWQVVLPGVVEEMPIEPRLTANEWHLNAAHSHPARELLVALDGEVNYGVGDGEVRCSPGTLVFFERDLPHDHDYPPDSPDFAHLWISLSSARIVAKFHTFKDGTPYRHDEPPVIVSEEEAGLNTSRLWPCPEQAEEWAPEDLARQLRALTILLLQAISRFEVINKRLQDKSVLQADLIASVKEHIRSHLGRGESLESIASWAGYSKYHFLRLFKEHAGMTVHQFINACRRERVIQLREQGHSQKEISVILGFSSPQSYSRWYRRQTQGRF